MGPDLVKEEDVDSYLALELVSSEPYTRFVYDDATLAAAAHRYLFSEGSAEFAAPHAQVRMVDGRVVAAAAWLSGSDLRKSRLRSAVVLTKGGFFRQDPDLRRRMQLAAGCLREPQRDDFYLSRLAVDEGARGGGLATRLLADFETEARRQGRSRLVLEVSPRHEAARALYSRVGFEEIDSRQVTDPDTSRELHYIHMAKPL